MAIANDFLPYTVGCRAIEIRNGENIVSAYWTRSPAQVPHLPLCTSRQSLEATMLSLRYVFPQ